MDLEFFSSKKYCIFMNTWNYPKIEFNGEHMPEMERPNWHYYKTDQGQMLHFRKEHIALVIENLDEK